MASATVKWIGGKRFVGIDSSNHSVVLSTSDEGVGMKPSELILVALGACSSVDIVEILTKKRMPPTRLDVSVSGVQDADPPWTYRKIHVKYSLSGKNLTEKDVAQAIHLSEEKYCSVSTTLRGVAEITNEFEITPEE